MLGLVSWCGKRVYPIVNLMTGTMRHCPAAIRTRMLELSRLQEVDDGGLAIGAGHGFHASECVVAAFSRGTPRYGPFYPDRFTLVARDGTRHLS